jgi:hypothetical protein
MLRMPNPGSDVDTIVRIFQELYHDLGDYPTFELDDITRAMIKRRNVTSQGALGDEALRRSTRPNRSLDPLYNQSKMYAEVYRILGLINSTDSALKFKFSILGQHLGEALDYPKLLKECLLGVAYPNRVVKVKGNNQVRLFVFILRCMEALDGKINRDEIILGPMNIENDRDDEEFQDLIKNLKTQRSIKRGSITAVENLSKTIGIATTTMGNYTRIPIGALLWTGWVKKEKNYFVLTDTGRNLLNVLKQTIDVRIDDFDKLDNELKEPLIRSSFYEMLGRAGFNIEPISSIISKDRKTLALIGYETKKTILFSPFQQLSSDDLEKIFRKKSSITEKHKSNPFIPQISSLRTIPNTVIRFKESKTSVRISKHYPETIKNMLRTEFKKNNCDIEVTTEKICSKYENASKEVFYPLVSSLFIIAGFKCELSRAGVNYARADAKIVFEDDTIPIEIKSPAEEKEISTKAIRQALENKIVFLSRKIFPCNLNTTTLVVGFNPPNSRSEVNDLVEDIKKVYGISVGIFDLRALLKVALENIEKGLIIDLNDLKTLKGIADVRKT